MKKILIQLIVLSVILAVLFEDAEAVGFFTKKGAKLALGAAKLKKAAVVGKLALPKLKKVAKKGALKKAALKKVRPGVAPAGVVSVPLQRPGSLELSHHAETVQAYHPQKPIIKPVPIKKLAAKKGIKKLALKKLAVKKLAMKKGFKKLGLMKALLG